MIDKIDKEQPMTNQEYIEKLEMEIKEYKDLIEKMKPVYEVGKQYQKAIMGIK